MTNLRLLDVVTIERGATYKSALIGLPGPVLLGLGSIQRNGGYRGDALRTYGGDSPERMLVRPGQLYASLKDVTQSADLLGAVARLPLDHSPARLTQDTVRLDPISSDFPMDYLYWVLQTPQYRQYCRAHLTGTTNLGLPREDFFAFEFPEPDDHLLKVSATLGAVENKIESNRRAISLAIERASLELNGGTERVRLGDVATISKGLSYKGSGLDDGTSVGAIPMLNLASFTTTGELKNAGTKWYVGDFKPRHRLDAWELVLANTDLTQGRELLGRGFLVPAKYEGAIHSHHTSVVRFSERAELATVLWAQIQSLEFRDRAKGFATGTTVAALPPDAVLDFELTVPASLSIKLANAHRLIEKAWQLEDEIGMLSGIRSFLLSELLTDREVLSQEKTT